MILKRKGHYDGSDEVIQKNIEMMASGEAHHIERETHYGTHLRVDVIPHGEGKVILTYSDITEIKQREAELEETTFILYGMIVPICKVLMLNFYNPKLLSILELKAEDLVDDLTFEGYMEVLRKAGHLGEGDEGYNKLREILELPVNHTRLSEASTPISI